MANTVKKDEPDSLAGLFGAVLRGVLFGIGSAIVLMLVLSAVALATKDPDSLIGWLAMAALLGGAFICGVVSVRSDSKRGLVAGIIGGAAYVLILWLISLFFRGEVADPMTPLGMALRYATCILAAFLGGLIGHGSAPRTREGKHSPTALARRQLRRH